MPCICEARHMLESFRTHSYACEQYNKAIETRKQRQDRMEEALRMIGYSRHTSSPRKGPKAQIARWGLGDDELPDEKGIRGSND